jgi:hypothetical protein
MSVKCLSVAAGCHRWMLGERSSSCVSFMLSVIRPRILQQTECSKAMNIAADADADVLLERLINCNDCNI